MRKFAPLVAGALIAGSSAAALAQPRDEGDEIVVTGERVPRSLRETPSSVVVITDEAIEAQGGAYGVEQLLEQIPNVQLGSGTEAPAIRGSDATGVVRELAAFLGGARPRTTLQVDGRAVSYYELVFGPGAVWDAERVEVFRSPQTTTNGRNSIAGAIFIETHDPGYAWEDRARLIVGDLGVRQASVIVSGPVVDDQIAVRLAGDLRLSRMSSDMADGIPGADIDRDDYGVARIKLLAEPQGLPGFRLEAGYVHNRSQAPQFEAVRTPFRDRQVPNPESVNGIFKINVDSLTARADYAPSSDLSAAVTASFGDALVRRFGLPGLGRVRANVDDWSIEAVTNWHPQGPLGLVLGASFLEMRQRQSIDITGLGIGTGGFRDRQDALGLFGELSWRVAPSLEIVAGGRYQRDSQVRTGQVGTPVTGILLDYSETFDAWLPKLSLTYDIGDRVAAGILVQRAYNPGGTTVNLPTRRGDSFEAEYLWDYELFLRASFAGETGFLSANLFYYDITDAQRPQAMTVTGPGGASIVAIQIANAPSALTYGAEVELSWRPTPGLALRAGVGLLDTEVRRTIRPDDPILGKDFQRAPNFSASASVDWRPALRWRLSAQFRFNGGYFSDDENNPRRGIDPYATLNLRAAYSHGPVTVFGYVTNAFDSYYLTYLYPRPAALGSGLPVLGTAGDPRAFGIGVETSF